MTNRDGIEVATGSEAKLSQPSEADSHGGQGGHGAEEREGEGGLIDSAQAGDREALNRLLAGARPRLLAVALRVVRDRDDAEDVVQESLLKVCRNLTRFEGRAAFSTWLHRIVVNTALDRLRRPELRHDRVAESDEGERRAESVTAVDDQTPERLYDQAQAGAVVQRAMARLSLVHREVLSLRELDGESYQEIASAARCPVGTVMSRLHHARRRLALELAPAYAA
jgi:RNA polymerase sigma-70 factor (ECF subfamily)